MAKDGSSTAAARVIKEMADATGASQEDCRIQLQLSNGDPNRCARVGAQILPSRQVGSPILMVSLQAGSLAPPNTLDEQHRRNGCMVGQDLVSGGTHASRRQDVFPSALRARTRAQSPAVSGVGLSLLGPP